MTTTFVFALFVTGALGTSVGWFLASVMLSRSIRDDLATLDAERVALDEEREMLTRYWTLDIAPPADDRVSFDLGRHKKAPGVVA